MSVETNTLPNLPPGWCWTTLAEIADINGGVTKDQKRQRTSTMREVPYLRVANVQRGSLDLREIKTILAEKAEIEALRLRQGDILFTEGGDRDKLGRGWVWNGEIAECIHQNHVFRARPCLPLIEPKFVSFHGNFFGQKWFTKTGKQTTNLASINKRVLSRFPVPLAPRNEQRRIVAKIEELFSDLDAGVAALERARANLKRYRATVLKSAVEGKLTEQWRAEHPATEPAAELLERILAERRKKWEAEQLARYAAAGKVPPKDWREKYVEPAGPDAAPLPRLLDGWCWANVEQLIQRSEYGTSVKCDYTAEGPPVLRIPNIAKGSIDLSDLKYATARFEIQPQDALQAGDLLMCRTNGSISLIGKAALVRHTYQPPHTFASYLLRFRFGESAWLPKWILTYASSHFGRRFIERHAASSAGQHNISLSLIHSMPIPLPPFAEQQEIVSAVDEQLSAAEKAEVEIEAGLHRAARLRQGILKRAFEGKLVAQDPADEPASVLLGRIRESRETELRIRPAPRAARARPVASGVAGNIFRRGAVASYIIRTLADRPSFGRTQLGKVLHLTQAHLGVDLALEFERYPAGPLDTAIYKLEGFARKQGWFSTEDRPSIGVRYRPGPSIGERCEAAIAILGEKLAAVDELLAHVAGMDADAAELFATVYAAWNDLLLDGRAAITEAIIAEVYGWDESKKRFPETRLIRCIDWMRKHGYVPTGTGQRTQLRPPVSEKKSRRGRKKP